MTLQFAEQLGRGEMSRPADGKRTATRVFLVYEDSAASVLIEDIIENTNLPALFDPHPEMDGIAMGEYSIRQSSNRANAYEVSYKYLSPDQISEEDDEDGTIDGADEETGVTAFSITVQPTIVDIWKSGATIPANKDNPPRTDIGGTLVSEGGYPVSVVVATAKITINQRFSGFFNAGIYLGNVGKRNSQMWHGFSAGSLLFVGVNVTQDTTGFNEVRYEMVFDNDYHLRQVPERDEDGNPAITIHPSDPDELNVFYKQPFPNTTNFGFLPY